MKKRAQFYLVAVILLLAVIASVYTIYNKIITKPEDKFTYNQAKEIEFEISKILERGVYQALSDVQVSQEVKNITDFYANSNPNQDLIVVFGTDQTIYYYFYNNTQSGEVSFSNIVAAPVPGTNFQSASQPRISLSTISINITSEVTYTFDLRKGPFVYAILKKEQNGERYITPQE